MHSVGPTSNDRDEARTDRGGSPDRCEFNGTRRTESPLGLEWVQREWRDRRFALISFSLLFLRLGLLVRKVSLPEYTAL